MCFWGGGVGCGVTWNVYVEKLWTWRRLCSRGENVSANRKRVNWMERREKVGIQHETRTLLFVCACQGTVAFCLEWITTISSNSPFACFFFFLHQGSETFTVITMRQNSKLSESALLAKYVHTCKEMDTGFVFLSVSSHWNQQRDIYLDEQKLQGVA